MASNWNLLMDRLAKTQLSKSEVRVVAAIARKTLGWNKTSDRLSTSQLADLTGISRRHVGETLQLLQARQIVAREGWQGQLAPVTGLNLSGPWLPLTVTDWRDTKAPSTVTDSGDTTDSTVPPPVRVVSPIGGHTRGKRNQKDLNKPLVEGRNGDWRDALTSEQRAEMKRSVLGRRMLGVGSGRPLIGDEGYPKFLASALSNGHATERDTLTPELAEFVFGRRSEEDVEAMVGETVSVREIPAREAGLDATGAVTRAHASDRPQKPPRPGGHKSPAHLAPPISRGARFVRVDHRWLTSLKIGRLKDAELRSLLSVLAYVAYYRDQTGPDGSFPVAWAKYAYHTVPSTKGFRVATKRHIARFIELGLLEPLVEDETGDEYLRFVDWRELSPLDPTGAERAARWRQRHGLYGRRPRRPDDPVPVREFAPHEREERAS